MNLEMNFPRRERLEQKWQPGARDIHSEQVGGRRHPGKIPCYSVTVLPLALIGPDIPLNQRMSGVLLNLRGKKKS